MSEIAENLRRIRTSKRIKQADLAKDLGVSPQTISAWETQRAEPSQDMVAKIAKRLGVSKEDINGRSTVTGIPINQEILSAIGCTDEEMLLLIKRYREADEHIKKIIRATLDILQER